MPACVRALICALRSHRTTESERQNSRRPETSIVTTASQNEAEESDESEEETAGERTTKVGRTRGGMKVAARIAAPSELLHGRRVGGSLHAGPHSLRPRVVAQVNAADSCLRIRRRRGAGGVFITVEPLAPCSLDTRPKVVARCTLVVFRFWFLRIVFEPSAHAPQTARQAAFFHIV